MTVSGVVGAEAAMENAMEIGVRLSLPMNGQKKRDQFCLVAAIGRWGEYHPIIVPFRSR